VASTYLDKRVSEILLNQVEELGKKGSSTKHTIGGSWGTNSKNSDGVDSQLVKLAVTHDGDGVCVEMCDGFFLCGVKGNGNGREKKGSSCKKWRGG
jgi:hypothetical protein